MDDSRNEDEFAQWFHGGLRGMLPALPHLSMFDFVAAQPDHAAIAGQVPAFQTPVALRL